MPNVPPKTHKRHPRYDKALCGMQSTLLTDVYADVTCKSCRLWLPVNERDLPKPDGDPA